MILTKNDITTKQLKVAELVLLDEKNVCLIDDGSAIVIAVNEYCLHVQDNEKYRLLVNRSFYNKNTDMFNLTVSHKG
jgi:hypothetical protein